jgi:hypothetical protein
MDKFREALRRDAADIEVTVSAELDDRIRASLESARAAAQRQTVAKKKSVSLWWASALTGIATTLLVVLVFNLEQPPPPAVLADLPDQDSGSLPVARPRLTMESAVFTAPLEDELDKLESDLKKAEKLVREELKISF